MSNINGEQSLHCRGLQALSSIKLHFKWFLVGGVKKDSLMNKYYKYLLIGCLLLLYLYLVTIVPLDDRSNFLSPDESSNYLTTKLYSSTGQMFYESEFSEFDNENILHSRHFANYGGKMVFCQYFGLPLIYGTIYGFFGDFLGIILSVIIALLALFYFVKFVLLYYPNSEVYSIIIFISLTPVIYYFNHPYFNATPAIAFFTIGSYYLAKFHKCNSYVYLLVSILMFSISILLRNNYILYIGLLILLLLIVKHMHDYIAVIRDITITTLLIFTIAILPILILNYETYGSPLIHGNKILIEYIIHQTDSSSSGVNILTLLFPSPIIIDAIFSNVVRLLIFLIPITASLALVGSVKLLGEVRRNPILILLLILFGYILCYRGSSDTYAAYNFDYLGFNVAIIRYWLILYMILGILAVAGLKSLSTHMAGKSTLVILILILLTSPIDILIANPHSLTYENNAFTEINTIAESVESNYGKENIIIFGKYVDKSYSSRGILVGNWWYQSDYYMPNVISESMSKTHDNTRYTILFDKTGINSEFFQDVNYHLNQEGLVLVKTHIEDIYQLKKFDYT